MLLLLRVARWLRAGTGLTRGGVARRQRSAEARKTQRRKSAAQAASEASKLRAVEEALDPPPY